MNPRLRLVALALLTTSTATTLWAQQDWSMYQANASHTGFTPIQIGFQTAAQRWSVRYGTYSNSAATTGGGKVFFASNDKKLIALDTATGAEAWRVDLTSTQYLSPPAFNDGKVYIQTCNHATDTYLRCYRADTGALVFQSAHQAQWETYLAPTFYDGKVYVNGGYYGGMYAFDGTSGQQLWFRALAQYDRWTPAVTATTCYAYAGNQFSAVDRATGAIAYQITDTNFYWSGYSMYQAPVLGGRDDAFVINGGRLVRFNLLTRAIGYEIPGSFTGQCAVKDGVVYAIQSGSLQARNQNDGALLWSWSNPGDNLYGSVALTLGHAFVHGNNNTYAIDLATHLSAWTVAGAGEMSITQGAIYLSRTDGFVTSFGFVPQPSPLAMVPDAQAWTQGPRVITVRGTAFQTDPTGLRVRVGGVPAQNITVVNDTTATVTVPVVTPGVYDVEVENTYGRGTLRNGFAVTPAIASGPLPRPNDTMALTLYQPVNEQTLALIGFNVPQTFAFPPFQGSMCINPSNAVGFLYLSGWFQPTFQFGLPIPNNPGLTGVNVLLQTLSGPSLWSLDGAFSNCLSFQIR
jgi:outer membrane protein assembly factor BamB